MARTPNSSGKAPRKAAAKTAKPPKDKTPKDTTPRARPSRGRSGKPTAPPEETAAGTPGFGEAPQAAFHMESVAGSAPVYDPDAGFGATADVLPALRSVAPRPEDFSPTAALKPRA